VPLGLEKEQGPEQALEQVLGPVLRKQIQLISLIT
jgi:hypothetical protein